MPLPYETPPTVRDPQITWLQTLLAGAILGVIALAVFSGWQYVHLTSRLQLFPRRRSLDAAFPYITLAQGALNWMSAWMLTVRSPIYLPVEDRRLSERLDRARGFVLRLIVTALFIGWSVRMWGLVGLPRLTTNTTEFLLVMTCGEVTAFLLLWLHVRRLSRRIGLRGLAWRAVVVLLIPGSVRVVLGIGPLAAAELSNQWRMSADQVNVALGAFVLTGVMAMLVMGRLAWALFRKIRTIRHNGSIALIA